MPHSNTKETGIHFQILAVGNCKFLKKVLKDRAASSDEIEFVKFALRHGTEHARHKPMENLKEHERTHAQRIVSHKKNAKHKNWFVRDNDGGGIAVCGSTMVF
jgi:hypothetical protein